MTIIDVLDEGSFCLNEGLAFFKNSKRLLSLANKIEKRLPLIANAQEKEEAIFYIRSLRNVAQDFADVENQYSSGNRQEAKANYDRLRIKYFKLVKDINSETFKKFLIGAGAYVVFAILLGGIESIGGAKAGTEKGAVSLRQLSSKIRQNAKAIDTLQDQNKKLEAIEKNLKLLETLQKKMDRARSNIKI